MHNLDNKQLKQRVDEAIVRQKRLMRIIFFAVSLFIFIVFVGIAAAMVNAGNIPPELLTGDESPVMGPIIMLGIGWFITLIFQGISLVSDFGWMDRSLRDQVIAKEIGRQLYEQAANAYEKPKRQLEEASTGYTISDDGELVQIDEEAQQRRQS